MRRLAAPLVALACLLALAGCSSLSGTGDKGYITGEGVPTEVAIGDRDEPVELTGTDLEGNEVDLADLRGTPVVVNLWWSQCPPCRVEQPDLNEAAAELGDRVSFVGINIRDSSVEAARSYVRGFDVPYPSIYSADGSAILPFAGTLTPRSIPSTVVLDADGRVAASVQGRVPTTTTLLDLVEAVLDE
ncbi:TlpA family protein disulfide reductase [Nocardioides sp. J2M5]|uniref:TlpA family protein disulfide reductase n=1 Tax=Nocardioides palaemonis TaxID=2829810 RepID=UPI001BA93332|nr:TlpA disulfide reductase family protein [Nocardioides palaemonis]MBS2939650.1 TlpA family protein disulfide reductase [Nocardioides palaemonis]